MQTKDCFGEPTNKLSKNSKLQQFLAISEAARVLFNIFEDVQILKKKFSKVLLSTFNLDGRVIDLEDRRLETSYFSQLTNYKNDNFAKKFYHFTDNS